VKILAHESAVLAWDDSTIVVSQKRVEQVFIDQPKRVFPLRPHVEADGISADGSRAKTPQFATHGSNLLDPLIRSSHRKKKT
jgi:hypothetical protein